MEISLRIAQTLVSMAIDKASSEFKRPIRVSVCDQYGFLLAFSRMDGAPMLAM